MTGRALPVAALTALLALCAVPSLAQDWLEMRSANFVVTSSAGHAATRSLVWQLEQIRSAIAALFAWARVDLDRPIAVFAVRDERGMRALAPEYWEQKGGMRPASVWASRPDQHYFAIRADVEVEDRATINPHITAYHAYVSLILQHSVARDLPLWFTSGFAGVLSNTIVRDTHTLVGPPIPWHLEHLRARTRLSLPALMKVTRLSPEYTGAETRYRFDAQSWALVHFLMFGDDGARRPKLDQFTRLVSTGTGADAAMREAFGPIEELEGAFIRYINRSLFTYMRVEVDAGVKREGFPSRPLSPSESAAASALFHVAMNRPDEARAAIADARRTTPPAPDSFVAEALLLDGGGKNDEARAAYERAVEAGTLSGYAHYRLATLRWSPGLEGDALAGIEKLLLRAVALNTRHPPSNAFLGEVRALRGSEGLPFARRAIAFAPAEPAYRLTAARILLRQKKYDEALKEAQAALAVAPGGENLNARTLIASIERAKAGESIEPATSAAASTTTAPVRLDPGIVTPRVLEDAKPAYTADAMRMRVEGMISLEAVVLADGTTGTVKVTKCDLKSRLQDSTNKADAKPREALLRSGFKPGDCTETFGLDGEAMRALKRWRFEPGTRDGVPVPVQVDIEMTFTLR